MTTRKKTIRSVQIFFIVVLFNLSWQNGIAASDILPGNYQKPFIFSGIERTYRIHIPPSFDKAKPIPLLIILHGGGGSHEKMEKLTLSGFDVLSDKEGFVAVYPDGVENHWNDGRENVRYRAHREKIDDVGFIAGLIEHLAKELNVDKKRIYVTGISNGAMMSYRLACELSEKITAIAPVAGALPENLSSCSPSRAVSVLIMNGAEDPLVPWQGGEIRLGRLKLGKVLSVTETVKRWVNQNQCSPSPAVTWELDKDPQDGTRVRRETYNQCREGTEVALYAIVNGGHTWPGGYQYLPESFIGKTCRDIDANEVIWNFFKKHTIK